MPIDKKTPLLKNALKENTLDNKKKKRPYNNKKRSNYRRKNGGRKRISSENSNSQSGDKLTRRYMTLVDQLQLARRKYYNEFHHHDPNRVRKLRRLFEKASEELHKFISELSPDKASAVLKERLEDKAYSSLHNISTLGDIPPNQDEIQDPHLLKTQSESNFEEDEEESVGTMDDYRSYKGISE